MNLEPLKVFKSTLDNISVQTNFKVKAVKQNMRIDAIGNFIIHHRFCACNTAVGEQHIQ